MNKLKSRKLWALIAAVVLQLCGKLDQNMMAILAAYMVGQGIADRGK